MAMKSTLKYYGLRDLQIDGTKSVTRQRVSVTPQSAMWNQLQNSYSMFRVARKPRRDSTNLDAGETAWKRPSATFSAIHAGPAEPTQERIVLNVISAAGARPEVPP
jgi:hypothetical protein